MSDQAQPLAPTLDEVQAGLLRAIECATNDFCQANANFPMEGAAKAALEFAQAYVILNPSLGPQGVPLAHDIGMANLQHQHSMAQSDQAAAHAAKAAAAAPSPAKGAKP
jgi:hypothetical protein